MHDEGCDRCRSNESYGHSLTELAVPACKSGEYNPPPSVPHMDGKRAAPRKGRRVVFAGIRFLCGTGPMCPAAGYAFFGGARGPRPTGQVRYPPVGDGVPQWSAAEQMPLGYDVPSARQRRAGRRIPTPVCTTRALASRRALARNDSASCCLGGRSRPPLQVFIGDSRAGRRGRRPLRNDRNGAMRASPPTKSQGVRACGTSRAAFPTE